MSTLQFQVKNQHIRRRDEEKIVAGSRNYLFFTIEFETEDWDRAAIKQVVFTHGDITKIVSTSDLIDEYLVPWEVIQEPGLVRVSVHGGGLITTNETSFMVERSGWSEDTEPAEPTPTVYEEILETAGEAVAAALDAKILSQELLDRADSGEFNGKDGIDGEDGRGISDAYLNDDYTLTLEFTDETTYTTPSIKGEKGDKGDTYELTESDKEDIGIIAIALADKAALGLDQVDNTSDLDKPLSTATIAAIQEVKDLIPAQASEGNLLADIDFVNQSIATNTANFIKTFDSVSQMRNYKGTVTNNDYCFVREDLEPGKTPHYIRYKWSATVKAWLYEYELNPTGFTTSQWVAINSNITPEKVESYDKNLNEVTILNTTVNNLKNAVNLKANQAEFVALNNYVMNNVIKAEKFHELVEIKTEAAAAQGHITNTKTLQSDVSTVCSIEGSIAVTFANGKIYYLPIHQVDSFVTLEDNVVTVDITYSLSALETKFDSTITNINFSHCLLLK